LSNDLLLREDSIQIHINDRAKNNINVLSFSGDNINKIDDEEIQIIQGTKT